MRLIDADAMIGELHTQFFYDGRDRTRVYAKIQEQPTADVVERKKGKWIENTEYFPTTYTCPFCDHKIYGEPTNFCDECGADLR